MERIPEPELMDEAAQAQAYAEADFAEPHERFVQLLAERIPAERLRGARVLDLGCGPADVTIRFARAFADCRIDGVDGAAAMLRHGRDAVAAAGMDQRIELIRGYLPGVRLPVERYGAVISNSLLHHLADPAVIWEAVRCHAAPGAPVFVMDLMRPADATAVERLVGMHAADAPDVLRRDFRASLYAAYEPDEVSAQLDRAGLPLTVEPVSDRHLVVYGYLP